MKSPLKHHCFSWWKPANLRGEEKVHTTVCASRRSALAVALWSCWLSRRSKRTKISLDLGRREKKNVTRLGFKGIEFQASLTKFIQLRYSIIQELAAIIVNRNNIQRSKTLFFKVLHSKNDPLWFGDTKKLEALKLLHGSRVWYSDD